MAIKLTPTHNDGRLDNKVINRLDSLNYLLLYQRTFFDVTHTKI